MEPITLIFLSGMTSGTILGDAFNPIGLSKDNDNVVQECTVKTQKSKIYDKELNDYINNEFAESTCVGRYIPPNTPIRDAIKHKISY